MMPRSHIARWILPSALACLLLMGCVLSSSASAASSYGELLRFNGIGTGANKGKKFELEEETHAFGVDPVDNSVYVGDEKSGSSEEEFRIQKYTEKGEFLGQALLKPGGNKVPAGLSYVEDLDGVAIDHAKGVIYVLVSYKRENADKVDPGKEVAGALYAFSTTPNGAGELVPAPGADPETGLLASASTLLASSEVQGKALLEPSGITVDPATHEVMILGLVDMGAGGGMHVALDRLSEKGVLGTAYVDPEAKGVAKAPDSPVVSSKGTVFFESAGEILQIPSDFKSAPTVLFRFEEPESLVEGPFKDELATFGENTAESFYGGGLAIQPEGGENEGRLIADAEVHEVEAGGVLGPLETAALSLHYVEEGGGKVNVSENGWVGGRAGEIGTAKSCIIGFAGNYPQVAGATANRLFVLSPASNEVIEFGPSETTTCPTAPKEAPMEALLAGKKVSNVNTGTKATLSAKVTQASVLSVEWKFGDGSSPETVTTPAGEQTQTAETQHKFANAGKATVEAVIHTDNLATPTVQSKLTLTVEVPPGTPRVTGQPSSQTVLEGQSAKFKSSATGEPTPTIQWEESRDGGTNWEEVGAGTEGGTTETLTVTSTTPSESGREYRAGFLNTHVETPVLSSAAKLTVETKAQHEAKEEEERKTKEEQEHKTKEEEARKAKEAEERKASEEASARAQQQAEAEAAKRAQEQREAESHKPPPPAEPAAAVKATGASLVSTAGAITVKLSCPVGVSACTGSITLKTLGAVSAAKRKAAVLTLATARFTVPGGQTKAITLHLSSAARKLLARSHTLRAKATIIAANGSGAPSQAQAVLTLRIAPHH